LKAQDVLPHWPDEAGRASNLATFHAAQAFIFEMSDVIHKSHAGVRGQFGRLVKDDPRFDVTLRSFLGRSYNFKTVADYETGPEADVAPERAADAVRIATRFVETVAGIVDTGLGDGEAT
jgi:uncharacterized protein (UPF0332 family)